MPQSLTPARVLKDFLAFVSDSLVRVERAAGFMQGKIEESQASNLQLQTTSQPQDHRVVAYLSKRNTAGSMKYLNPNSVGDCSCRQMMPCLYQHGLLQQGTWPIIGLPLTVQHRQREALRPACSARGTTACTFQDGCCVISLVQKPQVPISDRLHTHYGLSL